MKSHKRALIYIFICIFLWALTPIVSKLGQRGLDNYQFLFWSSLVSSLSLFALSVSTGKLVEFTKYSIKQLALISALGFMGSFLFYLLLYYGYAKVPGLEVVSIQYTWPIFIIIFSAILLKEKIGARNISAILIGFLGLLTVITKGDLLNLSFGNLYVDLTILFSAAVFGLYSVLSKKYDFKSVSAVTYMFLSATVFSFIAMMIFSSFRIPGGQALPSVLLNGVLVNGISYMFWLNGLSKIKASVVAPYIFLVPVLSTCILVLMFAEPFLPAYAAGLILVIAAGLISK